MNETELLVPVKAYVEARNLEVFPEVQMHGNRRIDIVGRRHDYLVTVEGKVSFSLQLIAQALRWQRHANECWIALPRPRKRSPAYRLGQEICRERGIGIYEVTPVYAEPHAAVRVAVDARVAHPDGTEDLHRALHPEQKGSAAGSVRDYSSKLSRTCGALVAAVRTSPGVSLRAAVESIEHHYGAKQAAISSLSRLLNCDGPERNKALTGVRIEGRGAKALLFPVEGSVF